MLLETSSVAVIAVTLPALCQGSAVTITITYFLFDSSSLTLFRYFEERNSLNDKYLNLAFSNTSDRP